MSSSPPSVTNTTEKVTTPSSEPLVVPETANINAPIDTSRRQDVPDEEKAIRAAGAPSPRKISGWRWALAGKLTSSMLNST